jgi:hypothetical protein
MLNIANYYLVPNWILSLLIPIEYQTCFSSCMQDTQFFVSSVGVTLGK